MRPLDARAPTAGHPPADPRVRLREATATLEGVFLQQLFQAMRATIPEGGGAPRSEGEKMFTSMLDEQLSQLTAARSTRGIGEAIYRQLSSHLPPLEQG
jgi:Rod binding domain-containing protein